MPHRLKQFVDLADTIRMPVFVISVENGETCRFEKLNAAHEATTGLRSSDFAGKTPHEMFPARLADTITRNYLTCVKSREEYSYEELLELSGKEIWWRTSLSPVIEDGVVTGVVGIANNITSMKTSERKVAEAVQEISRVNSDLQVLTSTTAHDLRGPMRQAKLILEMVSVDFQDLGDNKLDLLKSASQVIDKALGLIDTNLDQVSDAVRVSNTMSKIDIAHWCSDIIAVLDPLEKLDFRYPEITVECENFILDVGLRNLIDNANRFAATKMELLIENHEPGLKFTLADDGPGFDKTIYEIGQPPPACKSPDHNGGFGLSSARSLIEARKGRLWTDRSRFRDGATVSFTVPGRIVQ